MNKTLKKQLSIAFLVCICFTTIPALLPSKFQGKGYDYSFHYAKAKGGKTDAFGKSVSTYPPLYSWLSKPFTFRETHFYIFSLLFLGLAIPLTLSWITRNWVTSFFYFSATSFFYFFEQGVYPFALALLLCLMVVKVKDVRTWLGLLVVSLFTHSLAFYLVSFTIFAVVLNDNWNKLWKYLPACSGYFPKNRPDGLEADLVSQKIVYTSNSGASRALDFAKLGKFLVEIFPLPFLLMSLHGFFSRKQFGFLLLVLGGVVAGVFHYRFFYVTALFGLLGLTWFYETLEKKWQRRLLLFALFYGVFQFVVWFRYKFYCFPLY